MEILTHWQAGDGVRHIARNLGVARNTVTKQVKTAEENGLRRDRPLEPKDLESFVLKYFPQVNGGGEPSPEFMKLEQFRKQISEGLKENHASTVWQRLRDEQHLVISRPTFYRYVNQHLGKPVKAANVVVHRPEGVPGDEVQVDFGRLGRWEDPVTNFIWAGRLSQALGPKSLLSRDLSNIFCVSVKTLMYARGLNSTTRLLLAGSAEKKALDIAVVALCITNSSALYLPRESKW